MPDEVSLRSLALQAYLPTGLFAAGSGAVAPAIALHARSLGASVGVAGLVVAIGAVGQICGDVPAGALAARIGERRAMLVAVLVASVALVGCLVVPTPLLLAGCVLVLGAANSVFGLARQSFLAEAVPLHLRARAYSALGGTGRIGFFVGPLAAAPLIALVGTRGAFLVHLVVAVAVFAVVALVTDPDDEGGAAAADAVTTAAIVRTHARVLATLGSTGLLIGAVRASRQVVIPLWADHLGLDPATTSVVFGLSAAVDMLVFYPAGTLMDLRGRAWVAVPSMAVLGISHLLLPLAGGTAALVAVALLMGLGNGLGSGLVMTLGADVSPVRGRAEFLGVWRIFHDGGQAGGPLLLSAVASLAALGPAVLVMGGVGVLGAAALTVWIPRYAPVPGVARGGLSVPGSRPGDVEDGEERSWS